MTKIFSPLNIIFLALIAALFVFGSATIPADQMVPVHWNLNGEVDIKFPAGLALLIGPLECLVVLVGIFVAQKKMSADEFAAGKSLMETSVSIAFAAGLLVQTVVVLSASGIKFDVPQISIIFIGFVMLIIGNYLPKSQANRAAGIRFPWTLQSETVWAKTHHFGGKCFMAAGAVIILAGVMNIETPALPIFAITAVALAVGVVSIYSYSIRELN